MPKHALLIQAHQDIGYVIELAKRHPNVNIYVHIDAKSAYFPQTETTDLANLFLLNHRVAVHWGGFSQIKATLALFEQAFDNAENQFLHLLSGEDVLLQDFDVIEKNWRTQHFAMLMTCQLAPQYGYRLAFDTLHADSEWQRQFFGKVLTKICQAQAKLLPYDKNVYFGSQWFSVTRADWAKILPFIAEYSEFFERKLVPDEHFFQTLVKEKTDIKIANDNKRLIIFDKNVNNGNSPIYLNLEQLQQAKSDGFWFARKVKSETAKLWLMQEELRETP